MDLTLSATYPWTRCGMKRIVKTWPSLYLTNLISDRVGSGESIPHQDIEVVGAGFFRRSSKSYVL